jgi:hypothetical protein
MPRKTGAPKPGKVKRQGKYMGYTSEKSEYDRKKKKKRKK